MGWNVLTNPDVGNRKGYAGYEWDEAVSKYHVRNRVLDPHLGRWTRRDPLGYVDGMSVYEYGTSKPLTSLDRLGLAVDECPNQENMEDTDCEQYAKDNPMPEKSECCDNYPDDYYYFYANAKCFCKCAGDSDWSQFVRACLQCEYFRGTPPDEAHDKCYELGSQQGFGAPDVKLLRCWYKCGGKDNLDFAIAMESYKAYQRCKYGWQWIPFLGRCIEYLAPRPIGT
jgi:RHS repeat-associated protein